MKRTIILFLSILIIVFSGCKGKNTVEYETALSKIGKTFEELKQQIPSYEFLHLEGYDFSAECIGEADDPFAYMFFGTQAGPSLEEMAESHGKQLKCAGIYTTAEKVFPFVEKAGVSVDEFLEKAGTKNSESDDAEMWNCWLLFKYNNYSAAVKTTASDKTSGKSAEYSGKVEPGCAVIITDDAFISDNHNLCEKFIQLN